MSPALESTDAKNKLEDLSGVKIKPGENPYKALIEACHDDAVRVAIWKWLRLVLMLLRASTGWGWPSSRVSQRCRLVKTSSASPCPCHRTRVHC